MSYKTYGCQEAYNKIVGRLTEGCDFIESLKHLKGTGNEYVVYMGELDASRDKDVMKQVIGRGGCYFIRTTQECDLDFIWHDRESHKIEFWGPKQNLSYAMGVIQHRLDKITKSQLESKCLDNSLNLVEFPEIL